MKFILAVALIIAGCTGNPVQPKDTDDIYVLLSLTQKKGQCDVPSKDFTSLSISLYLDDTTLVPLPCKTVNEYGEIYLQYHYTSSGTITIWYEGQLSSPMQIRCLVVYQG
jgi:hypothetical protein